MDLGKVLSAESPFRWDPQILEENINEIDLEDVRDGHFSLINLADKLIHCYNEFRQGNMEKSFTIINETESRMANEVDQFPNWNSVSKSIKHVIYTTKATILLYLEKYEDSKKAFEHVEPFDDLNDENKAAIFALRSLCLALYSYEGTKNAQDFIKKSIKNYDKCAYWWFLQAFYLNKIRKLAYPCDSPSLVERESIEKANELEKNEPLFMVYLADVYRETAVNCLKSTEVYFWFLTEEQNKKELNNEIEEMCQKSRILYQNSYAIRKTCPLIAFRCAYGLMLLPTHYQNVKLAKKILTDTWPNFKASGFGNLVNGLYYQKYGNDRNMALRHLEVASNCKMLNAKINIVKVRFPDKEFDSVKYLFEMLNVYKETPKQGIILSQLVSYYIFVMKDQKSACELAMRYYHMIGDKRDGNMFERHHSCFINTKGPISLINVLADEVKFVIGNKTLNATAKQFYTSFVHRMNFAGISVLIGKPQNLRQRIIEGKSDNTTWHSKLYYKNNNKNQYYSRNVSESGQSKFFGDDRKNVAGKPFPTRNKNVDEKFKDNESKHKYEITPKLIQKEKSIRHVQDVSSSKYRKNAATRSPGRNSNSKIERKDYGKMDRQSTRDKDREKYRYYRCSDSEDDRGYRRHDSRKKTSGHQRSCSCNSSDDDTKYRKSTRRYGNDSRGGRYNEEGKIYLERRRKNETTRSRTSRENKNIYRQEKKKEKSRQRSKWYDSHDSETYSSSESFSSRRSRKKMNKHHRHSSPSSERSHELRIRSYTNYRNRSVSPEHLRKNSKNEKCGRSRPTKVETVSENFKILKLDEPQSSVDKWANAAQNDSLRKSSSRKKNRGPEKTIQDVVNQHLKRGDKTEFSD